MNVLKNRTASMFNKDRLEVVLKRKNNGAVQFSIWTPLLQSAAAGVFTECGLTSTYCKKCSQMCKIFPLCVPVHHHSITDVFKLRTRSRNFNIQE